MEWLNHLFQGWGPKDWITLVTSVAALIFSLLSYFQKSGDSKTALRKQLSDTLKEITEINTKDATFRFSKKKEDYPPNYIGLLNDQRRYLVRQAGWITDRIGRLVTPFDRVMIAGTFGNMDYPDEAERFYKSAMKMKQSPVDKSLTFRNYGRFLYRIGRREEALTMYCKAVEAAPENTDQGRYYRGEAWLRLADDQKEVGDSKDTIHKTLEQAKAAFSSITRPGKKAVEIARVEEKLKALESDDLVVSDITVLVVDPKRYKNIENLL